MAEVPFPASTEAIVGAVSGSLSGPTTVLLGRFDTAGRLQYGRPQHGAGTEVETGPGRSAQPDCGGAPVDGVVVLGRLAQ